MSDQFAPAIFDLIATGHLRPGWDDAIIRVARERAVVTYLDGSASTSAVEAEAPLTVLVVTGEIVQAELPWLYSLYTGPLCELASGSFAHPIYAANDLRSSININVLRGLGARYEKHVDSNPVTGVLFVTMHDEAAGGALTFHTANGDVRFLSHPGECLFFDARDVPHEVEPLRRDIDRVTVVMNFYDDPVVQWRPADLDSYLYEDGAR